MKTGKKFVACVMLGALSLGVFSGCSSVSINTDLDVFNSSYTSESTSNVYNDGTYTGIGNLSLTTPEVSLNYDVTAVITVIDGVITEIDIDPFETNDDVEKMIADIKEAYLNTDGSTPAATIDAISEATLSYDALMDAMNNALAQASGQEVAVNATSTSAIPDDTATVGNLPDGTYTGVTTCSFGYDVNAIVLVRDNRIAAVDVTYKTSSSTSAKHMDQAIAGMAEAYVGKTASDPIAVDTVSHSTASSKALNQAVTIALSTF